MTYQLPTDADGVKYHGREYDDKGGIIAAGVDEHGNDKPILINTDGSLNMQSVVQELHDIKQRQQEILERLDDPIDTRVTGSIVEEKVINNEKLDSDSKILTNFESKEPYRIIYTTDEETGEFSIGVYPRKVLTSGSVMYAIKKGKNFESFEYGFGHRMFGWSRVINPMTIDTGIEVVNESENIDFNITVYIVKYSDVPGKELTEGRYVRKGSEE